MKPEPGNIWIDTQLIDTLTIVNNLHSEEGTT